MCGSIHTMDTLNYLSKQTDRVGNDLKRPKKEKAAKQEQVGSTKIIGLQDRQSPDLDSMSDEELQRIIDTGGMSAQSPDLDSMSDEGLQRIIDTGGMSAQSPDFDSFSDEELQMYIDTKGRSDQPLNQQTLFKSIRDEELNAIVRGQPGAREQIETKYKAFRNKLATEGFSLSGDDEYDYDFFRYATSSGAFDNGEGLLTAFGRGLTSMAKGAYSIAGDLAVSVSPLVSTSDGAAARERLSATVVEGAQQAKQDFQSLGAGAVALFAETGSETEMAAKFELMKFNRELESRHGDWRRKILGESFASVEVDPNAVELASELVDPTNLVGFGLGKAVVKTTSKVGLGTTSRVLGSNVGEAAGYAAKKILPEKVVEAGGRAAASVRSATASVTKAISKNVPLVGNTARLSAEVASLNVRHAAAKQTVESLAEKLKNIPTELAGDLDIITLRELDAARIVAAKAASELKDAQDHLSRVMGAKGRSLPRAVAGGVLQAGGRAVEKTGEFISENLRRIEARFGVESGFNPLVESAAVAIMYGYLGPVMAGVAGTVVKLGKKGSIVQRVGRNTRVVGEHLSVGRATQPFFRRLKNSTELGGITKGTAATLDFMHIGWAADKTYSAAKATSAGAGVSGGFGYVASGGDINAAAESAGAGGFFGMAGGGYGAWENYTTPGFALDELYSNRRVYEQSLSTRADGGKSQFDQFKQLPPHEQLMIGTYALSKPDMAWRFDDSLGPRESGKYNRDTDEITINRRTNDPIRDIFAHEVGHSLEARGLGPISRARLVGDATVGQVGEYTLLDDRGEPVKRRVDSEGNPLTDEGGNPLQEDMLPYETTDEFKALKTEYVSLLYPKRKDETPESYEARLAELEINYTDEYLASELFAEHYADRTLGEGYHRDMRRSPVDRIVEALAVRPLIKDFLGQLGVLFDSSDRVAGSGVFKDLRRNKTVDKLVTDWNKDRGLGADMPAASADTVSFDTKELRNPELARKWFSAGGVIKTDKNGKPIYNGIDPVFLSAKDAEKAQKELASEIRAALDEHAAANPDDLAVQRRADGSYSGAYLPDDVIARLEASGNYNAEQIRNLKKITQLIKTYGGGAMLQHFYQASMSKGRKGNKSVAGRWRNDAVYGFFLSKEGNFLISSVSWQQVDKNARKASRTKAARNIWNSDNTYMAMSRDIRTYLQNVSAGLPGDTGIGTDKKDYINNLLGYRSKDLDVNEWHNAPGKAPSIFLTSLRLDRMNKAEPLDRVDYTWGPQQNIQVKHNRRPEVEDENFRPTVNETTRKVADNYFSKAFGKRLTPHSEYEELPVQQLKDLADYLDKAKHAPEDPEVLKAYGALAEETKAQYEAMIAAGVKIEPWKETDGEPYANSAEMVKDVTENNHLWFFMTETGFGSGDVVAEHPLMADSGIEIDGTKLVHNDLFRAVHDYFGHTQQGFQFGPRGEYNAWREHSKMFGPEAQGALAAETLAQSAWVNNGKHIRREDGTVPKQGEEGFISPAERPFADQKAFIVPEETLNQFRPAKLTHRRSTDAIPDGDVILFGDGMKNDHYGDYEWELRSKLEPVPKEVVEWAAEFYGVTTDEAQSLVDPEDIVNSAGAWDDREFVSAIWQEMEVGSLAQVAGYATQDGAVVLDRTAVNMVGPDNQFRPETPEFKKWFGDSKVVDADGEPLVVYHGTDADFERFDRKYLGQNTEEEAKQVAELGFWFNSTSLNDRPGNFPSVESNVEAYLAISNPIELSFTGLFDISNADAFVEDLKAEGYDGIVTEDTEFGGTSYIAFEPTQIKSATGNNGDFDGSNPNINRRPETPEFKKWFGDSKVVDADGEPLVVYHGTDADFNVFSPQDAERAYPEITEGSRWIYFTKSREAASFYSSNPDSQKQGRGKSRIIEAYLRADSPLVVDSNSYAPSSRIMPWTDAESIADRKLSQITQDYEYGEHDSVHVIGPDGSEIWMVREAAQIKSATGNNGDFDGDNPNINRRPETPEFKKWFGDSKVVNADGTPQVMYHGTQADIEAFKISSEGMFGSGIYFTDVPSEANYYSIGSGGNVMPVYLRIENPAPQSVWQPMLERLDAGTMTDMDIRRELNDAGYDGIIQPHIDHTIYVAFEPTQIKSATGNNGDFDGDNPNINRRPETNSDFTKAPSDAEATAALSKDKKLFFGAHRDLEPGTPVGLRIDIPAFTNNGTYVVTVHEKAGSRVGKRLGYDGIATVDDAVFLSNERGAAKVRDGLKKFPLATVEGKFNPSRDIPADIDDWTPTGYNPKDHSYFYDKNTDLPVLSGSQAISVGNTVFVKDAVFGKVEDFAYRPELGKTKASVGPQTGSSTASRPELGSTVPLFTGEESLDGLPLDEKGNISPSAASRWLAARNRKIKRIPFDSRTKKSRETIAAVLVDEIGYALSKDGNALGWYEAKVNEALETMGEIHPEILTDKDAETIFTAVLAITSNGQAVDDNFARADVLYTKWKKDGSFPEGSSWGGQRSDGINAGLKFLNRLVGLEGTSGAREFLTSQYRFGDIKKIAKQRFGVNITGELADHMVPGAIVFGPKIGGGFFSNLQGDFTPVTMDLWMMRTWNRINGSYGVKDQAGMSRAVDALRAAAEEFSDSPQAAAIDKLSDRQLLRWAKATHREWAGKRKYKNANPFDRPAKRLEEASLGKQEAPRGGSERKWVREVFTEVDRQMAEQGLPEINNADKQALLWYFEKDLHALLGVKDKKAEPTDYALAARKVVSRKRRN